MYLDNQTFPPAHPLRPLAHQLLVALEAVAWKLGQLGLYQALNRLVAQERDANG